MTSRVALVLLVAALIGACATSARQENAGVAVEPGKIPVAQLTGRINDTVNLLSPEDRERLSNLLGNYEHETGHQIAVLIVPTLAEEAIESFCLRTANTWRLGRKGIDDGVVVCMAMKERQVRIELGTGMERFISNADAKQIIDTEMTPFFRKGDFAEGLERGLKRLMEEGRRFVAMDISMAERGNEPLSALRSAYAF